jgi:hypothetical protein
LQALQEQPLTEHWPALPQVVAQFLHVHFPPPKQQAAALWSHTLQVQPLLAQLAALPFFPQQVLQSLQEHPAWPGVQQEDIFMPQQPSLAPYLA